LTPAALELRGIVKRFGSVHALRGADFILAPGEVHALLGENGAGKSTLMHIAYGLLEADAGELLLDGSPVRIGSPREARRRGIGMVHQHFTSIGRLSVEENLRLRTMQDDAGRCRTMRLGEGLDPRAMVETLSVAEKQRLEILMALAAEARVLLLDEPTAVLAPSEVEELLGSVRAFAVAGGAVVLITHKLHEALAGADRVTVLRRGETVYSGPIAGATRETLAEAMLGAGPPPAAVSSSGLRIPASPSQRPLILAKGLEVLPLEGRGPGVAGASLEVHGGEIVGLAAVGGNGHRELLLALAGLLRAVAGRLEVARPLALVPEDRSSEGLIPALSLAENVVLEFGGRAPWVRGIWLDWRLAQGFTAELLREHAVDAAGPDAPAATLSGGNQQKLVLGRALARKPRVLLAENPTRGLDIRASAVVAERLRAVAAGGAAVLLYSSDLDEVLALADRVLVMHGGRVREAPPGAGREVVGRLMLGEEGRPAG